MKFANKTQTAPTNTAFATNLTSAIQDRANAKLIMPVTSARKDVSVYVYICLNI